ncbi:MAG: GPI anchored serine-threonine rich family protein [Bacteroidetes bacterium]|nr:GPI anchored serine-threonine rich family protein [Bacteroidota bacterium]
MKRLFPALAVAFACVMHTQAQSVTVKKIELNGEKVIIYYDLDDSNASHEFLLNVFASKDNFTAPLTKVKGDVGQEVKPGLNKKIEWNIMQEYGGYKGKLALELRGKVYVPFVKLQGFDTEKKYKRGKLYNIVWKPGSTDPIHIELYKGNERVAGDMNIPNNGTYTLNVPSSAKKGSDYRLKISDSKTTEYVLYTDYFKVAPKVPLLLKVVPVVAVAGALATVAKGGGGEKGKPDITLPPFPNN